MLKLKLSHELAILGFKTYQEFKPYKERAEQSPKVVCAKRAEYVRAMEKSNWVVKEYQMQSPGSTMYYNYKKGYGHGVHDPNHSWETVLEALEQPVYIIVYRI